MIPQIKKILYATDLSKNAAYAFFYAVDMAKKYNASIVILHVVEPIPHVYTEVGVGVLRSIENSNRLLILRTLKKGFRNIASEWRTIPAYPVWTAYPKLSLL